MIEPKIAVDDKEVTKALSMLGSKSNMVMARAANKTIATTNKAISQEVRKRYRNVKARDIRQAIFRRSRANAMKPTAELEYKSQHIGLYKLGMVTPKRAVKNHRPGCYKVSVKKNSPWIPMRERPRPFVQVIKNEGGKDHTGLFRRTAEHTRKIEELYAPAVTQMMKNEKVIQSMEKTARKALRKNLEHEIDWELRR